MKNNAIKSSFLISCTFLGAVIGAGFASGKEIAEFFIPFDKWGSVGIFISCFVMSLYFYAVLKKVSENNIDGTYDYLVSIFNPFFAKLIYLIMYVFAFVILCAMFAGSGALMKESFGISFKAGSVIMGLICCFVFWRGKYGILNANVYLTPVMAIGIVYIGIQAVIAEKSVFFDFSAPKLITTAVVYASYNSLCVISVFCEMGDMLKNRRTPIISAVFSGIILFLISFILYDVLLIFKSDAIFCELPMLRIAGKFAPFYTVILFFAMVTTAVSSAFSLVTLLQKYLKTGKTTVVYICIAAYSCSLGGFSSIIAYVYPFFGYLGIFLIAFVIENFYAEKINKNIKSLKKAKNKRNNKKKREKRL